MNYKLYKLKFTTPVQFGDSISTFSEKTFSADRLFSTFCINRIKADGNNEYVDGEFIEKVKEGKLLISDAMPYVNDTLYIPKPIIRDKKYISVDNIEYIPYTSLTDYLKGSLKSTREGNKELANLGTQTAVGEYAKSGNNLINVEPFVFNENNGLYFIVGYEDEDLYIAFDDIMQIMGYIGIGGRLTKGYGKFEMAFPEDLPEDYLELLNAEGNKFMSITTCVPQNTELDALDGSNYEIVTKSVVGSFNSDTDVKLLYSIKSGSIFTRTIKGDVYNLANGEAEHPVYKYSKPILMRIG